MPAVHVAWLLAGLLVGMVHAAALWRSVRRATAGEAARGPARLLAVGAVLVAAAFAGEIGPASGGWAAGFFAGVIVYARRPPAQSIGSRAGASYGEENDRAVPRLR